MISGCGAGCAHRRGEQRGDVTGRQRRARGALDRHTAGAGAELAKGQQKSRRAATARAAAATSAGKVDMISGCGAGCAHRRGEQRGDVTGRRRRASGALARHAARSRRRAGRGQEESTRSNGAGGSGDVGRKGRHDLGLWRGVCASQRPSSEVMSRGDGGAQAARELGARREPAPSWQRGKMSRRAATARAAAATSAGKVDMISGCGAGCAHRRGEQRGDVTGRQRRARGALDRHAAGAGAELAQGQEESTRSNGAGGSGDVGRKGRHDLGLWRGVCASQRRAAR